MKYLNEYRDPVALKELAERIRLESHRCWRIMEVCGGQTNTIVRYGLDRSLSTFVNLLHGPGCPVCVTPVSVLDMAQELAGRDNVILCTFGDMMRVPGSSESLLDIKASGADVRAVYSPCDALALAGQHPDKQVVFLAIGFETTAPLTALAILQAREKEIANFSVLVAHMLIPPAIEHLLETPEVNINALLAPGHVCTITGTSEYERLSAKYSLPIVVTGFEPADLLQGTLQAVRLLEEGRPDVVIQYARAVTREGNRTALEHVQNVFNLRDQEWRGLGAISQSGLQLKPEYADLDAVRRFNLRPAVESSADHDCARVLQGLIPPTACPKFGQNCTPVHPLGAPMVSPEGACAAYMQYQRWEGML